MTLEGGGNSDASQLTRQTVPGIRSKDFQTLAGLKSVKSVSLSRLWDLILNYVLLFNNYSAVHGSSIN